MEEGAGGRRLVPAGLESDFRTYVLTAASGWCAPAVDPVVELLGVDRGDYGDEQQRARWDREDAWLREQWERVTLYGVTV